MTAQASPDDDADRQALLELLLAEEGIAPGGLAAIARRRPSDPPVLSYAQERLWFLQQFEEDTAALNIRAAVRLIGPLDQDALRDSIVDVLQRHESLRTRFTMDAGSPRPNVVERFVTPLTIDDLRGTADPGGRTAAILGEEAERRFDLEEDLPIHLRLVQVADDEHILSLVVHHVAADGWSVRIIFSDLAARYRARAHGHAVELSHLAIDYTDYAAWQRTFVSGHHLDRQLEYWRTSLGGPLPLCEIPPDHARPRQHTFAGGQLAHHVDASTSAALSELARRCGATDFMVLLAAFDVVLARRMDLDDVIVGTPVAGRVRPELEPMVGMFLNMLALRVDLGGDPTFVDLVGRVRDVSLGAFDHQDVSFEQLLSDLRPARDVTRTPLFQVLFNMMSVDAGQLGGEFPGVRTEVLAQPDLGSKFDVTMYVVDREGQFELLLVYNRALYRPDTMRQLLEQYVTLLDAVVADPTRPIHDYSLVTPEAAALLPSQHVPLDATWHGSIVDAVRRHAAADPDSPAIVDATGSITYGQLAQRMEQVAAWLRLKGIGSGQLAAIHAHRSPTVVWAVLGILASGASYILLDPAYPTPRLAQYLHLARPSAWLAVAGAGPVPAEILAVLDELGVDARATVDDWPSTSDPPSSDVDIGRPDVDIGVVGVGVVGVDIDISAVDTAPVEIGPDDVACLTFTSGSTGTPKAVIGRHGSLTHFLPWQTERFGITSTDRFSMLSGLAHDPLQRDMFWPLWVGATLVVPDPEEIPTPGWLAEWFRREQITVSHLTPAMGRLFTEHAYPGAARQLRKAFFIGDVLPRRDVERLREVAPGVEVVNLYGTTETQRASAHHVVGDDDLAGHDGAEPLEILPLGTGIPGTQVLVRSASGSPAGFGEIGEIWVRSHHLAAGYLDRPEETAERFLDLAAPGGPGGAAGSGMPGDRAYRTGDRGRYRWDGAVEHRGRADGQVQLRGFRIETAEVRDWLLRLDDVGDAAVVVRDDLAAGTGDQRLVAYVVPATHRDIDPVALRTSLRTSLPTNMVPNDIVVLERLPLTPNGKLDRAALPAPDGRLPLGGGRPCDEVEERLAGWFGQVLGRHDVGVHDNFFDLGGYSLLATRLFAIIESETGRRIPVATLFQAPTVATLATIIRSGVSDGGWSSLVPIQPGGSQIPFFYVTPYMISVLQLAHLAVELGPDQPLYGLQPQGLDGSLAIHTRIEEMAAHYIDEMKSVQPRGPYRIGGHCSGAWVAFEIARQLEAADDEIAAIVLVDQGPPAIQRSIPSLPRYFASRARFYLSDRRLMPAVRWQLKIVVNRLLMRRIASRANRFTEEVKITHRHAYGKYAGGTVDHDIVLIRSQESIALPDKTWYLRWGEMTTGSMRHTWSSGTHANLLERPYVEMLADRLRWAFDPGVSEAADV